jgi:hypothetical protein
MRILIILGCPMDIKIVYYREREKEIQGLAREFYENIAESVQARYGSVKAEKIRRIAFERFQEILSDLPDIGGDKNPLIWTYIEAAVSLGFFLAAKAHSLSFEEAGRFIYDLIESYFLSEEGSSSVHKATPESIAKQRDKMKAKSGTLLTPESWCSVFVEPVETAFDIGWNNTECGILKLYEKYGAREYVPYMCMTDIIIYPLQGLGLRRTRTLVESDHCDFRVKLGGTTVLEPFAEQRMKEWGKKVPR